MVPLTSTGPKVYVATMKKNLSKSYCYSEDNLNCLKNLKLNSYLGGGVADCCAEILVYSYFLEISAAFKNDNLGYITCIFEDTYASIFCL